MKKVVLFAVAALAVFAFGGGGAYAQAGNPVNSNTLTITLNEQNASGQSGTATLTQQGGELMVTFNISNGSATAQPAHIHKGTCANLDPTPAFPLTSAVNGASQTSLTTIDLQTLLAGQYAINVHKSAAEAKVYVACGDIVNMRLGGAGGGTPASTPTPTGGTMPSTGNPAPGMPSTGNSDFSVVLLLAVLALALTGTGLKLGRRRA